MVGSMRTDIAWVAALGLLVLAIACDSSEGPAESPAISVALVQVSSSTLRERVRGIGTLRASDRVEIRAEVPGIVRGSTSRRATSSRRGTCCIRSMTGN